MQSKLNSNFLIKHIFFFFMAPGRKYKRKGGKRKGVGKKGKVTSKSTKAPRKRGRPPKAKKRDEETISILPIMRDTKKILNARGLYERKHSFKSGPIQIKSVRMSPSALRKLKRTFKAYNEKQQYSIFGIEC